MKKLALTAIAMLAFATPSMAKPLLTDKELNAAGFAMAYAQICKATLPEKWNVVIEFARNEDPIRLGDATKRALLQFDEQSKTIGKDLWCVAVAQAVREHENQRGTSY